MVRSSKAAERIPEDYYRIAIIAVFIAVVAVSAYAASLGDRLAVTSTANSTKAVPVINNASASALAQDLRNISYVYPQANASTFSCSVSSQCALVQLPGCPNPFHGYRQLCINENYSEAYWNASARWWSSNHISIVCPSVPASCACASNLCTVIPKNGSSS